MDQPPAQPADMIWTLFQIVEAVFAIIGLFMVAVFALIEASRHERLRRRLRWLADKFIMPLDRSGQ